MHELPVAAVIPQIKTNLLQNNRLVLQAPPGSGKTTLVPLALLEQPWIEEKKIIMLEPRRLAARNAAARMAYLLGEKVGERVGYQIRADRRVSYKTKILVVTEGILTRMLQDDPALDEVALIIFDEFHERNLHADLSLAFSLQSQELLREDLKILLMSATLNSTELSQLLDNAPIVKSQGRSFPVENIFLDSAASIPDKFNLADKVCQLTIQALSQYDGNILVFLPGVGEIKQVNRKIEEVLSIQDTENIHIAPLFGDLSQKEQDKAVRETEENQRKVVLATNIAETSITIDGISVVIDSGLQRISVFNPRQAMNSLQTVFISQASAEQRSGRAGRLGPGTCFRLWSENRHKQLVKHQTPEILHSDLTPLMLELAKWGIQEIDELVWQDKPGQGSIDHARELLAELQAIDEEGRITTEGEAILALGLHPRLGHLLICAIDIDVAYEASILVALLTEKDILQRANHQFSRRDIDLVKRMQLLLSLAKNSDFSAPGFNKKQARLVLNSGKLFFQRLNKLNSNNYKKKHVIPNHIQNLHDVVAVLLAFAYPDRVAQCRNKGQGRYLMSSGKGAFLDADGEFGQPEYLVIADLDGKPQAKEAKIFLAAEISFQQLMENFSHLISENTAIEWNSALQRVEGYCQKKLGKISLNRTGIDLKGNPQVDGILLEGVREYGLECLKWSKQALHLQQRVNFLNFQKKNNPKLQSNFTGKQLPDFSDNYLLANLSIWLLPFIKDLNSVKQLQKLDYNQILLSQLNWEQQQFIEHMAPGQIRVASGSNIAIDYSDAEKPILAVKLQELFGSKDTPAIIGGQFKLLLHLLSPAMRPMQVTDDLGNFWTNTYPVVKKELQGKYKKHYWPEDPINAKATNKIKRFM